MIFIDADYYIGLYFENDPHHQMCIQLSSQIDTDIVTSYDVVDEVTTKLSYIAHQEVSEQFLRDITSSGTQIVYPTETLFHQAYEIFHRQTRSKVSLTDCMNMAIAKSLDITTFLSFDQIYTKNGFSLFS